MDNAGFTVSNFLEHSIGLKRVKIVSFQIFSDDYTKCEELNKLRKDRHYTFEDEITCSREKLANYEETVRFKAVQCEILACTCSAYRIVKQRRLWRVCANAQTRLSLRCLYTHSMDVNEGSDQTSESKLPCIYQHIRLIEIQFLVFGIMYLFIKLN